LVRLITLNPEEPIVEGARAEARIGIPADLADGLTLGRAQTVVVGDRPFAATLTALLPELESTSRTVMAVLTLETAEDLTLGQTARLVLRDTQPAPGFWLPTTALVQGEQGMWWRMRGSLTPGSLAPGSLDLGRLGRP
jgi:hypothetical protein